MVKNIKTATVMDTLHVKLTVREPGLDVLLNPVSVRLSPAEARELAHDLIVRAEEVQKEIDQHVHFVRS